MNNSNHSTEFNAYAYNPNKRPNIWRFPWQYKAFHETIDDFEIGDAVLLRTSFVPVCCEVIGKSTLLTSIHTKWFCEPDFNQPDSSVLEVIYSDSKGVSTTDVLLPQVAIHLHEQFILMHDDGRIFVGNPAELGIKTTPVSSDGVHFEYD